MRFFHLMLSLLILVLSIVPCSEKDHCCEDDSKMTSVGDVHSVCTPFCASCVNFSALSELLTLAFQSFEIRTPSPISLYQSVFISSYIHSFWQPPKLNS